MTLSLTQAVQYREENNKPISLAWLNIFRQISLQNWLLFLAKLSKRQSLTLKEMEDVCKAKKCDFSQFFLKTTRALYLHCESLTLYVMYIVCYPKDNATTTYSKIFLKCCLIFVIYGMEVYAKSQTARNSPTIKISYHMIISSHAHRLKTVFSNFLKK